MRQPPTVKGSALWGLYQWSARPLGFLDDCARRYGDCLTAKIGSSRLVFFSNPEAIAQIFATHSDKLDISKIEAFCGKRV